MLALRQTLSSSSRGWVVRNDSWKCPQVFLASIQCYASGLRFTVVLSIFEKKIATCQCIAMNSISHVCIETYFLLHVGIRPTFLVQWHHRPAHSYLSQHEQLFRSGDHTRQESWYERWLANRDRGIWWARQRLMQDVRCAFFPFEGRNILPRAKASDWSPNDCPLSGCDQKRTSLR